MAASIYSPLGDGPDGPSFRLLTLLPAQALDDALECTVAEQSLARCDAYEALSYCWGDAADRMPISCNGQLFEATRNLEAALRALRYADRDRCLWIDAVCINQDDVGERNAQVLLMRSIYRSAANVIVWLGRDAQDSSLVLPLCRRIYEERSELFEDMDDGMLWGPDRIDHIKQKLEDNRARVAQQSAGQDESSEEVDSDISDAEALAVSRLLRRPWFQRCWVVQEYCLAKDVTVMCGPRLLPWNLFFAGCVLCLITSEQMLKGRPEELFQSNFLTVTSLKLAIDGSEELRRPDLLRLLWMARPLQATDPRDKVYSVLGLIQEEEVLEMALQPDYGGSVEESYLQVATKIIWSSKNLDILTTDRMRNPQRMLDLPSWVPDWSYLSTPAPVSILSRSESWAEEERHAVSPFVPYCASGPVNNCSPELVDTKTLRLSGFILDSVVKVEEVLTVPAADNEAMVTSMASFREAGSFFTNLFTGVGSYIETLVQWEDLAMDKTYRPYPTGESADVVFAATMSLGNVRGGQDEALKHFEAWRSTLRWPRRLMLSRYLGAQRLGAAYKISLAGSGMLTSKARGDRTFATATELTLYRRLARTSKGYLAVVPPETAVGDSIALFGGCKMPLVLKARGQKWELVGPAYVHGVMHGEAWDSERCGPIDIS